MKRSTKRHLASWVVAILLALVAVGVHRLYVYVAADPARKARRLWGELCGPGRIRYFLMDWGIADGPGVGRQCQIMRELAALGPLAKPYLIRALDHGSDSVRRLAAEELGKLGPEAKAAAPKLLHNMKDDAPWVSLAAAEAAVRVGRGDVALPVLAKLLRSPDERDRHNAAMVLGKLGPLAEPLIPDLIRALEDAEILVRDKASDALARIGPPAVPALVKALEHRGSRVREHAAWALGEIGLPAVPALKRALEHPDPTVRERAARVLGQIETLIPNLIRALEDPIPSVRDKVSEALARIGPPAVPALMKALEHRDGRIRAHAAWALGEIGPGAAAATTALERATKDEYAWVRSIAAKALKRIQAKRE